MATDKKTAAGKAPAEKEPAENKKAQPSSAKSKKEASAVTDARDATAQKPKAAPVKKAPTVAKKSAKKEAAEMDDPEVRIESAINRTEEFLYKNGKMLLSILVVILIVVGGFLSYKYLYLGHRSEKAGAAMFVAEQHFAVDSFALALNGDGSNAGFLDVINDYGSTSQGNIARHYAGICYFKLGDMDRALEYLSQYRATSGVPNEMINVQNLGLQGDIYVQKKDYQKAADLYVRAVEMGDNSFSTPSYLKKLALVYNQLGRTAEATAALQRIADQYPASMEGRDVEKYIGGQQQK